MIAQLIQQARDAGLHLSTADRLGTNKKTPTNGAPSVDALDNLSAKKGCSHDTA